MVWKVIESEPACAAEVMGKDRELLGSLEKESDPILHFYTWMRPSITYGHFLEPSDFFSENNLLKLGIDIARRPTGGGIIFHLWDLAFSALVPSKHPFFSNNTLDNYAFINEAVALSVKEFLGIEGEIELTPEDGVLLGAGSQHFCMAKPTRYDVMVQGKKVAGAAQRKTKAGFLHQGSISLQPPCFETVKAVLHPKLQVVEAMKQFTYPLLVKDGPTKLSEARACIKKLLTKHLNAK